MPPSRSKIQRHRDGGYGAVDLIVALVVAVVVALFVVMGLTRGRDAARAASCQRNLAQIGLALAYYDEAAGALPTVGEPASIDPPAPATSPGPLKVMLETLGASSFLDLEPGGRNLDRPKAPLPEQIRVAGFVCPGDSQAFRSAFPSPVSYRATTGDDPRGSDGGFAIGRRLSLNQIEAGDGLAYTSAFAERLIGDGHDRPGLSNYALVDRTSAPATDDWRGDAGSSWRWADYRTTLLNHAIPPGYSPSVVARDGRSALMGASSGHARGVHLLMFDGSSRLVAPSINPKVWRSMATVHDDGQAPTGPSS